MSLASKYVFGVYSLLSYRTVWKGEGQMLRKSIGLALLPPLALSFLLVACTATPLATPVSPIPTPTALALLVSPITVRIERVTATPQRTPPLTPLSWELMTPPAVTCIVYVDGVPAKDGTHVEAWVDGKKAHGCLTSIGEGGEAECLGLLIRHTGTIWVQFFIDGVEANESPMEIPFDFVTVNLSVGPTPEPTVSYETVDLSPLPE